MVVLVESKNIVLPKFFLAMLLLAIWGVSFASVNPKIQLQNYSLSEIPAQPGHTVALEIFLKSIETDNCADRVAVQVSTTYPVSVQGRDTQYIDRLCYSDGDSKGTLTFLLPVDPLGQTGTYQVTVTTTYEKRFSKFSESNTVNLRVGGYPSFNASVASSSPLDIYPGDTAKVTATFQNTGNGKVQSARVAFDSQDGLEVKWAGKTQELGQIAAFGSASATFSLEAAKDLAPGPYHVTASLAYSGEDGTPGSETFVFDVPIKPKAEFAASAPPGVVLVSGDSTNVVITLANTGSQAARNLKVSLRPIYPFSTDGTVRFVDSLMAHGEANVTFAISADKDAGAGRQLLTLLVDFEDPQGNKFSDTADFSLQVRRKTIVDQATEYWYIVLPAALAIGMLAYRRIAGSGRRAIAQERDSISGVKKK